MVFSIILEGLKEAHYNRNLSHLQIPTYHSRIRPKQQTSYIDYALFKPAEGLAHRNE